ncbi:MAG: hypothetical protein QOE11_3017 [Solirubrobacteraceae bacterium]|jgi:hypothetical protein|nr:hypothetical protein [Solirubrobacteraceae bacterium]
MSLFKQISDYVKSPQAKAQAQEFAEKAKQFANDPKRKEDFESVKRKVTEKLGKDDAPKPAADTTADAAAPKPDAEAGGHTPAA